MEYALIMIIALVLIGLSLGALISRRRMSAAQLAVRQEARRREKELCNLEKEAKRLTKEAGSGQKEFDAAMRRIGRYEKVIATCPDIEAVLTRINARHGEEDTKRQEAEQALEHLRAMMP